MAPWAKPARAPLHSASVRPCYEWIRSRASIADAPSRGLRTSPPPRCHAKQLKLNIAWSQFTSAFESGRAPFVKELNDDGSTTGPVVGSAWQGTSIRANKVITSMIFMPIMTIVCVISCVDVIIGQEILFHPYCRALLTTWNVIKLIQLELATSPTVSNSQHSCQP